MRTIVGLAVVLSIAALTAADEVVLRETFEQTAGGPLPTGWSADGPGWSVGDGVLRGAAMEGETTLLMGAEGLADVALSADVHFVEARDAGRWLGMVLREGGPKAPGVQFTIRRDMARGNGLELAARRPASDGGEWRVFQTASIAMTQREDRPHRLRVEARGESIRAYVDGERVFDCFRGAEVEAGGRLGFRINGCAVRIDNVEVSRLDPVPVAKLRPVRTHPLVIAHRGFSYRAPENTLAAYRQAIEAGADMAECDVWLSADRIPVLQHDESLKRTTGVDAAITSLPLAEIRKLDAGRWKSPEFAGERIPTLVETLRLVAGKLRLVIEVKPAGMEKEVIAAIGEAGMRPSDVMIFSFRREVVEAMVKIEPRLPTTWLIGQMPWRDEERRETLAQALSARASAIGLPVPRVDAEIVRLAHESGFSVFVWTVNDPADMRYLARLGVDGIISDRPDLVLEVLEASR